MLVQIKTQDRCPICGNPFVGGLQSQCQEHRTRPVRFYLYWCYKGERFRMFGFTDIGSAVQKAATISAEIKECRFNPLRYKGSAAPVSGKYVFSDRWQRWVSSKAGTVKPTTIELLGRYLKTYLGSIADEDVRSINADSILCLREHLQARGLGSKTIKNVLDAVHSFLRAMADREVIERVPKFPAIRVSGRIPGWIDRDSQERARQSIAVVHRPIFSFLFEQGVRPGEARALHWNDLDVKNRTVTIRHNFSLDVLTTTKTNRERMLPLTDESLRAIGEVTRALHHKYVFTYRDRPYSQWMLDDIWRKAAVASGVTANLYEATRHSFASQLVNSGVDVSVIRNLMGHSSIATTMRYAHVSVNAMRKAIEAR